MDRYKVVALVGKSGSGKDTLRKHIIEADRERFCSIVRDSSRPKREGEWQGVDYNFVDAIDFAMNNYHEEVVYNNWHYGTRKNSLSKSKLNVGCYDQDATIQLINDPEIDLYILYIEADDKTRLLRQLNREENPNVKEIVRRFQADDVDYSEETMLKFEYNENGMSIINNVLPARVVAGHVTKLLDIYYKI